VRSLRQVLPGVLLAGALVTACGTRLPDSAFPTTGAVLVESPKPTSSSTSGPVASTGPTPGSSGPASSSGPGSSSGPTTPTQGPGAGTSPNTASDIGVTPTTVTLGLVSSRSNAFDPSAFVGPQYGAAAFVDDVNRRGGVHGRQLRLVVCDDHGEAARNQQCVRHLVEKDKVFAFVSNAIFSYAGAPYVQSKGVPDVAGQPIDTAYEQFSHLWDIYGVAYPRDGSIGYHGKLEGGTEVYRYFATRYPKVARKAGVVYYNQSASQRYGENLAKGLQAEGFTVISKEVNFALPDYDSAVLDMKAQGVEYVYDALDAGGNENLCNAMDADGLSSQITAKVTTTQSWTAAIGEQYSQAPQCRSKIWATGNTLNYDDTSKPQVKAFRDAVARLHTDGPQQLSEWSLEGWAGAQWMADAMASCGAALTRRCVEAFLSSPQPYDGHGLFTPRNFTKHPHTARSRNCLNVARWVDGAGSGKGGWVSQVADMSQTCFDVPNVLYSP
jgi:branched-chain amino acid transport system substrate-binding protein